MTDSKTIRVVLRDEPTPGMQEFLALAKRGHIPVNVDLQNDPFSGLKDRKIPVNFDLTATKQQFGELEKEIDRIEQHAQASSQRIAGHYRQAFNSISAPANVPQLRNTPIPVAPLTPPPPSVPPSTTPVNGGPGALIAGGGALLAGLAVGFAALQGPISQTKNQIEEIGTASRRAVLGIASVLQASQQVFTADGRVSTNIGAQVRFQERQAEGIQLAARAKLLPLGIAGSTESTFVQGITSALSQRGINANSGQIATIAERLGGVIRATRPQLLENPSLLNRDLQDVLSGLPQAQRTVLGSVIRQSIPGLAAAKSGGDVVRALDPQAAYAEVVKNSDNPAAVLDRTEGARSNFLTAAGNAAAEASRPGVRAVGLSLEDPKTLEAAKTFGAAVGGVDAAFQKAQASGIKLGAGLVSAVDPINKFVSALGPLGPALLGAAAAASAAALAARRPNAQAAIAAELPFLAQTGSAIGGLANGAVARAKPLIRPGLGGKLAAFGASAAGLVAPVGLGLLAGGLLADLPAEAAINLSERIESSDSFTTSAIDKLQAGTASTTSLGRFNNILDAAGLKETFGKIPTERNTTSGVQLGLLNLIERQGGKAFGSNAADFYSLRQGVRSQALGDSTKSFTGLEGEIFKQGLLADTASANGLDARSELTALHRSNAELRAKTPSRKQEIKLFDDQIGEARATAAKRQSELDKFKPGDFNAPANPFDLIGLNRFTQATEARSNTIGAQAEVKSLEAQKSAVLTQDNNGNRDLVSNAEKLIDVSRKVVDYKNLELEATKKQAEIYSQIAEQAKGAFLTGTVSGASSATAFEKTFLGKAIEKQEESISKIDDVLGTISGARGGLSSELEKTSDPVVRSSIIREQLQLDALAQSKELEKTTGGLNLRKFGLGRFEASLAENQNKFGAVRIQNDLAALDTGTFQGAIDAASKRGALANAKIKGIDATLATSPDQSESLGQRRALEQRNIGEATRAGIDANFAKASGVNKLERAQIELGDLLDSEAEKRRSVIDSLALSKNALDDFNKSLESRRDQAETGLAGLAKRIKEKGGSVPFGADFDDGRLAQADLRGDVDSFNQQAARLGIVGTATGGQRLNLIQGNSPFEQGIAAEGHKLEDAVGASAKALDLLPNELEAFRLALRHTIDDLNAKLNPAAGAATGDDQTKYAGTPGYSVPTYLTPATSSAYSDISANDAGQNAGIDAKRMADALEELHKKIGQLSGEGKTNVFKIDDESAQKIGNAAGGAMGRVLGTPN